MDCRWGDETCPCQDGDPCHYEGENPMFPRVVWEWLDVVGLEAAEAELARAFAVRDGE